MAAQGWDIASEADAPLGSVAPTIPAGWDVAHEEPVETARERMDRHRAMIAKAPGFASSAHRVANDALDLAGNALAVVPTAVTGVAADIFGHSDELANKETSAVHDFIAGPTNPDLSAAGTAFAGTDTGKGISGIVKGAHKAVATVGGEDLANAADRVTGHVAPLLPAAGPLARTIGEGTGVVRPAVAAAVDTVPAATAPNKVLESAGYKLRASTVGNMTGADGAPSNFAKVGETVGGSEAVRADYLKHNRGVTNGWGATDIGLPRDAVLNEENIARAEAAPSATYQRVRGALQDRVPVSEDTAAALRATNAPDVLGRTMPGEHANSVALLTSEPMNGGELMDRISALRQEGYKRTTAAPGGQIDPAIEAYGNAQLDAANALESELNARVAATNPRLAGDYQAARKLFAKINTVKRSLVGYNIDPAKVAKAAAKTDAIDGGLGIVAHAQTHAPTDIGLHVPAHAGLNDSAVVAGAGGAVGGAIAAGFGHPTTAALLASLPVVQYGVRKALGATRGETAAANLDATAHGPLGQFFGRDDSGFHPSLSRAPQLELTPPPGDVFERGHQPSLLRSGENVPVAEQGGLPPGLTLTPPAGSPFEAHQPGVLRTGESVPAAESTQTPTPSVRLTPPPGPAFEAHPPVATSSQPAGGTPTAPQYTLPLGDTVAGGNSVVLHHGTPGAAFDKFDNTKSRSGSGANARGAGTYFSDKEGEPRTFAGDKGGHVVHSTVSTDTIDRMLDLDKPLKDQPRVVAALHDVPGVNLNMTGEQLRAKIAETEKLGKTSDEPMAKWLESKGIPGVKYAATKAGKPTGANNYILHNAGRDAAVTGSTRVKGGLGDVVAERTKVGGGLSADDLKLAE